MAEQNEGNVHPSHGGERESRETRSRRAGASRLGEETADALRDGISETGNVLQRETPNIAAAALIGVGVAIVEPELIPGLLVGAGAILAPKLLPAVGTLLRPVVKAVVKTGYEITTGVSEALAEAREQVEDMVAEARAEHEHEPEATEPAPGSGRRPRRPQPQPA